MNSEHEQEVKITKKAPSLIEKLEQRQQRYKWELEHNYEHHIFDGDMVWTKKNENVKNLMKYTGFKAPSKYLIAFIFADYLLRNSNLIIPGKSIGEIYYSNSVARDFANHLRDDYGIKVGTIGLNLPVYEKAPKEAKQLLHSAYQALSLLQRAINNEGILVTITLLLPTELVEEPLRVESPEKARRKIMRRITESMGELKGNMLASLEFGDIDRLHNPHLHGLLFIPGNYSCEKGYQRAKKEAREILVAAVGKTNNAQYQLKFDNIYSQGWTTYSGKDRVKVSKLLRGSAYVSPNSIRSAGAEFYEQVRAEVRSQERINEALLSEKKVPDF